MISVRYNLIQYGASAYLRPNFFKDIPLQDWNLLVEPKIEKFKTDSEFLGYMPKEKLVPSLEAKLTELSNLIIKLEDTRH